MRQYILGSMSKFFDGSAGVSTTSTLADVQPEIIHRDCLTTIQSCLPGASLASFTSQVSLHRTPFNQKSPNPRTSSFPSRLERRQIECQQSHAIADSPLSNGKFLVPASPHPLIDSSAGDSILSRISLILTLWSLAIVFCHWWHASPALVLSNFFSWRPSPVATLLNPRSLTVEG